MKLLLAVIASSVGALGVAAGGLADAACCVSVWRLILPAPELRWVCHLAASRLLAHRRKSRRLARRSRGRAARRQRDRDRHVACAAAAVAAAAVVVVRGGAASAAADAVQPRLAGVPLGGRPPRVARRPGAVGLCRSARLPQQLPLLPLAAAAGAGWTQQVLLVVVVAAAVARRRAQRAAASPAGGQRRRLAQAAAPCDAVCSQAPGRHDPLGAARTRTAPRRRRRHAQLAVAAHAGAVS